MKYLALSKNCDCWLVWIIYCIVGTHGNLILFVKRNEEIDQIFTSDQLNDEFERVVKEWKNNDAKNDGKDDDRNDMIDIKNDVQDYHLRLRILVTMKNNWVHWKIIEYIKWTQR